MHKIKPATRLSSCIKRPQSKLYYKILLLCLNSSKLRNSIKKHFLSSTKIMFRKTSSTTATTKQYAADCVWKVMAHAQKPDFVFRRNGRVRLNLQGSQFSRLMAAEVCASAVVMLDTPCSEVVWRVMGTHSIRQFPLHFPSRASPCAITFQLDSNNKTI